MRGICQSFILILAAGGAVLAPLCASGHGVEFLSARLTLLPDAEVLLEVTADYGANPMIVDEAAARAALADPIRLRQGEEMTALNALANPQLTEHDDWETFAPAAYLPAEADAQAQAHSLLTAAWRWRSTSPEVVFEMPKGKKLDVLLWTQNQTEPKAPPRWMLLLGGDRSKAIAVAWRPWWQRWATVMASGCLAAVVLGYFSSRVFTFRQRTL